MPLISAFMGKGPNGFGYGSTAEEVTQGLDLSGRTYLVTGCNSGIGLETLRVLGLRGGFVIALARSQDKAKQALEQTGAEGEPVACELSEPASVRAAVQQVQAMGRPIDAIICNAGIMALPKLKTQHGLELQFLTNHIGHFILVTGLLDRLTERGRVVMVSSAAHKGAPDEGIQFDNLDGARGYSAFKAYGQSKLANLLFAKKLAKKFNGNGQLAFSLHPGVIATNLGRHMNAVANAGFAVLKPLVLKTPAQGAATQVYLATAELGPESSGLYFSHCNPIKNSQRGDDSELAERLWEKSEAIVAGL